MDILLIGGKSSLMEAMIGKLYKEGHRIYVITIRRNHGIKNRKVFEYYYFPYESNSLKEVFDSVNPDVVLFTGAFDSNFRWNNVQREALQYSAAMINIMMAYSLRKKGRFIYLSSEEVYENSYPNNISEDERTSASSFRAMVLAEAERTCLNYHIQRHLDTVVLRLDHLIDIRSNKIAPNNLVGSMCLEAMETGKILCDRNHTISLLSMSDAVNFIYRIIACETHALPLYNLSSSSPINGWEIGLFIQKHMDEDVELVDQSSDIAKRNVLSNQMFMKEFHDSIFHESEEQIEYIVDYMTQHRSNFLSEEEKLGCWGYLQKKFGNVVKALVPYAECCACFLPFFMLNNRATGSRYFSNLDFYLLYVLLFAIVHGQSQATFAAILAVGGYIFRHMYEKTALEVLVDFNTYVWIAQLFIVGLVVGYMRDKLRLVRNENKEEVEFLEEQLEDIKEINISNSRMKNLLITQIVNQQDSMGRIYEITSSLTECAPSEVIFKAAEVVQKLMETKDVAIYTKNDKSSISLRVATSEQASVMGQIVNNKDIEEILAVTEKDGVYINKKLDAHYPLMARAIYEQNRLFAIVMIWGLPWERMNLAQANLLTIIARLTEHILLQAERYLETDMSDLIGNQVSEMMSEQISQIMNEQEADNPKNQNSESTQDSTLVHEELQEKEQITEEINKQETEIKKIKVEDILEAEAAVTKEECLDEKKIENETEIKQEDTPEEVMLHAASSAFSRSVVAKFTRRLSLLHLPFKKRKGNGDSTHKESED